MTVVVTGASQGIGRAVALAYAADGARLALLARNESNLDAVAEEVRQRGGEALVVPCDVTDEAQIARAEPAVREALGVPDVLVNNAGLFQPGGFLEITPEAFRQQVEVNLTSAFLVTRAFLPAMLERGDASGSAGDVVFMASIASLRGYPGGSAYGAAKHGLLGLARTLREETKERGLRVIAVMPGATLTPSWDGVDLPPDRLMPPEAIASAVVSATSLPATAVVEEIVIRPQLGDL